MHSGTVVDVDETRQPGSVRRGDAARTPRQARRPARERLLVAADELFYGGGITSTGVDAVIEQAGVATGSLYKNFGGKDALVAAYLHARDQKWRTHWEKCIAEQTDPIQRVLALFTAMERWDDGLANDRGCAHVAAALQLPADHPGARVAADHKRHIADRLHELCVDTPTTEPADLAQDVLLIYEGMHTMIAMDLDPDPISRARGLATQRLALTEQESSRGA